jgi:hypothetical protein
MDDVAGPIGSQHIETAPRDGTPVRLRFQRGDGSIVDSMRPDETVGRWLAIEDMKTGGAWFDLDANYLLGPVYWAPYNPPPGYTQYTGYRP